MNFSLDLIPDFLAVLAALGLMSFGLLLVHWVLTLGVRRGTLATLCRMGWTAPLFMSFFPATMTAQLPRTVTLRPVHVLLDDSASMTHSQDGNINPAKRGDTWVTEIENECVRLGCIPKITRLSEQSHEVALGYTPLSQVLDAWAYKAGTDPWVLISDGGDAQPTERWHSTLKGVGRASSEGKPPRGLILGFPQRSERNIWIKVHDAAPFSFEERPLQFKVTVHRKDASGTDRVQLQALLGESAIGTTNVTFDGGETEVDVEMTVPPLPRGQQLVTVRALPIGGESTLWDNTAYVQLEVLPNTVGVLHLLGSPSWDGRFVRRYLKSEPKYDLISFFILRDPWDSQQVSERELSLIPFPVERLFREELPNFRVVIVQNFTLFQFLLPEYQNNLVKFVQDGGGLLFIGGPRALSSSDLMSSPLREILPFEYSSSGFDPSPAFDLPTFESDFSGDEPRRERGPVYDPQLNFTVEMGRPDPKKRALSDVYDDWEGLAQSLTGWRTGRGLHHMERVKLKSDTTVLLKAKAGRTEIPLAVASNPGRGRALWLFSDSFWRLAMTMEGDTSRQVYNRFMQGAMTWLMRQDLRKPLTARSLSFSVRRDEIPRFHLTIQGPAARYFDPSSDWKLVVCGGAPSKDQLTFSKDAEGEWEISGPLPAKLSGGDLCPVELAAAHPAFGSVKVAITGVIPQVYPDKELDAAPHKLLELAQLTDAKFVIDGEPQKLADGKRGESVEDALGVWLGHATGQDGVALPNRFKTMRDFYWVLGRPWFWLLILLLPLEVIIRKWDQLFGGGKQRST